MWFSILLFFIVLFGTVIVYFAMGKSADSDVQRVKDRLLGKTKTAKTKDGAEAPALMKSDEPNAGVAQTILNNLQLAERVQSLIEQAGLRWTSAKLMQFALLGALAGFLFAWYMLPPPFDKFAWGTGIAGFCAPFVYVIRAGKARMKKFEEQFPDSLEFVARSMRAGASAHRSTTST